MSEKTSKKQKKSQKAKEEEQELVLPEVKPGSVKMDILLVISQMQHQNGLRGVGDYLRYSHFCRTKIRKLRKNFNLTQGKKKFQKVSITPNLITDNKVLLIAILECERNWAYGMFHKQELTAIGEDIKRLRYEITRKLKRASQNAETVKDLCVKVGDPSTQVEAEAYYYLIKSNYLIFTRKFQEALDLLKKAAKIYEKIGQLKDTLESVEYKEKIKSMKTSMRLCLYNLSSKSEGEILDEGEFEKTVNEEDIQLNEKFEEIKSQLKKEENKITTNSDYVITYHGMTVPIKNEKLKELFKRMTELTKKIESTSEIEQKILLFQDCYNLINGMSKLVKKIKSEEENNDNFSKIYGNLLSYIENLRLKKYIEKNLFYVSDYSKDYSDVEKLGKLFEKENTKMRVKPHELIKLYDNLIEYQNQLKSLEKDSKELDTNDIEYKDNLYNMYKSFYTGLFYVQNKKYIEAYTLMMYCKERIKEIKDNYENAKNENFQNLFNMICFVINQCYIRMNIDSETPKNTPTKKDIKDNKKIKYNPYLYDSVVNTSYTPTKSEYENLKSVKFSESENLKNLKNSKFSNFPISQHSQNSNQDNFKSLLNLNFDDYIECKKNIPAPGALFQVPLNTKLIQPKPLVYDLSYARFDYPMIDIRKNNSKSFVGRAFGFLFGN